jgi:hypothetical protein
MVRKIFSFFNTVLLFIIFIEIGLLINLQHHLQVLTAKTYLFDESCLDLQDKIIEQERKLWHQNILTCAQEQGLVTVIKRE